MEGRVVKLYLEPGQEGLDIKVAAYDDEGRLAGSWEHRGVRQVELNARARINPQVNGRFMVVVVENARVSVKEGVLRVEDVRGDGSH